MFCFNWVILFCLLVKLLFNFLSFVESLLFLLISEFKLVVKFFWLLFSCVMFDVRVGILLFILFNLFESVVELV